jgi:hypothetical protein
MIVKDEPGTDNIRLCIYTDVFGGVEDHIMKLVLKPVRSEAKPVRLKAKPIRLRAKPVRQLFQPQYREE